MRCVVCRKKQRCRVRVVEGKGFIYANYAAGIQP